MPQFRTLPGVRTPRLRRSLIAMSIGACLWAASPVYAQSNTTGAIFGNAGGGSTVTMVNKDTGLTRTVTADDSGRYRAGELPPGRYDVTIQSGGSTVVSREVLVTISSGVEVSALSDTQELGTIEVNASSMPAIDVSQVDTRTVFTSDDLQKISVKHDITSVALLAPSVVFNSSYLDDTGQTIPSFGGSASSENAYYINGYPVTNPLTSIGYYTLPFDAIDQQQILVGGYGAEFGRSTGGVVNVVTKRGTNEWKAGAYTSWSPASLRSDTRNRYYPDTGFYGPDHPNAAQQTDGTLYQWRADNRYWEWLYGVYAGGPIIKDKLFIYVNAEQTEREGGGTTASRTASQSGRNWVDYDYKFPRWLAKVDWHITDNHMLEFTGVSDVTKYDERGYEFDYDTLSRVGERTGGTLERDDSKLYIGKYTGYLTDNLTLSALYGRQQIDHTNSPFNYDPNCPRISAPAAARAPGLEYTTCQTQLTHEGPGADETKSGRFDVSYRIGDHELRLGYEGSDAESTRLSEYAGGYVWVYMFSQDPTQPVDAAHGVGAPADAGGLGPDGYFARRQYYTQSGTITTKQRAQYLEDRWQVTDNLLLQLGLRNEQFTNYTGSGQPYVSQRHQLAPRLGASWDINGDSSMKLFGNAGRYHLAMPNNVALRAASGSLYTQEFFTYTGVDPVTGAPTGLNNIPVTDLGYSCPGNPNAISSNLECGQAPNPRTVAAKDLKSHYQDEYMLGFEQELNQTWTWGVKGMYRNLRSAIDDTCTQALGGGCFIFNPGVGNTFYEEQEDGSLVAVHYSADELALPKLKRKYYAVNLSLEHRLTDNWYGKIEYLWSRNWGNTEGQLASELDTGSGGQTDVSVTQDWDLPQLMHNASGLLPNHRKHQFKLYGFYQMNPEWRFGGSAIIASGRPRSCTSYYPTPDAGLYNGAYYYWCGLPGSGTSPGDEDYVPPSDNFEASPRGSRGSTPWTYTVNLNVAWNPGWLDNRLTVYADVFNVFNRQSAGAIYPRYAASRTEVNQLYGAEFNYSQPRQFRFTVRYDF